MMILVVEDEEALRHMIADHLRSEGYGIYCAGDGEEALSLWREHQPDLIILDVMLPLLSGWEVLKKVRSADHTPIIMLTARADEIDKLMGLEMGADDYITKPFSPREMAARVRAVLRRSNGGDPRHFITLGNLKVDMQRFEALMDHQPLQLTGTEFKILLLLAENPGQVFSRLQILERVYGDIYEGYERTVDTHINNLRRKMEAISATGVKIKTVYGVGYKITDEENNHV